MAFVSRPRTDWKLRTRTLPLGEQTVVMGILNVTPDSFSDGGQHPTPQSAVARGLALFDEGAHILDIGGESTRPGAHPTSTAEEQHRVLAVIEGILHQHPDALLSIDTYKAATARAAILAGSEIVNDVSGLLWDHSMAATCAELRCGLVLMHARGKPDTWSQLPPLADAEVLPLIQRELGQRLQEADAAGIARNQIVLDPGFGFGKIGSANFALLAAFDELQQLSLPLLAGTSRKGFLANAVKAVTGSELTPDQRIHVTVASTTAAILAGASLVRVHDVRAAVEAAAIADAILAHRL